MVFRISGLGFGAGWECQAQSFSQEDSLPPAAISIHNTWLTGTRKITENPFPLPGLAPMPVSCPRCWLVLSNEEPGCIPVSLPRNLRVPTVNSKITLEARSGEKEIGWYIIFWAQPFQFTSIPFPFLLFNYRELFY